MTRSFLWDERVSAARGQEKNVIYEIIMAEVIRSHVSPDPYVTFKLKLLLCR